MSEHILLHSNSFANLSVAGIDLLKQLISIPSFSKEEDKTADFIQQFLESKGIKVNRKKNNVWVFNEYYNPQLPTILFNSHHDTVKPNNGYTLNPFEPIEKDGKLFGLGSNDAGGALVALMMTFLHFSIQSDLKFNIIYAATAEEEISGVNGIESILTDLGKIEFAIVGEPTEMNMAIAEKGLLVLDCVANGKSSHAAHDNPCNAITNAIKDINWFQNYKFPKHSDWLGDVRMNVTMIKAGLQHNVIPDKCEYTVDLRSTDAYTNSEILDIIKQNVSSDVQPRSLRLNPSSISINHPFIQSGINAGRTVYGSPTISDQALMNFPSVKMGPGNSFRSHTNDEFIYVEEISLAIELYIKTLSKILF
jgi:acetylornithine deacetylase